MGVVLSRRARGDDPGKPECGAGQGGGNSAGKNDAPPSQGPWFEDWGVQAQSEPVRKRGLWWVPGPARAERASVGGHEDGRLHPPGQSNGGRTSLGGTASGGCESGTQMATHHEGVEGPMDDREPPHAPSCRGDSHLSITSTATTLPHCGSSAIARQETAKSRFRAAVSATIAQNNIDTAETPQDKMRHASRYASEMAKLKQVKTASSKALHRASQFMQNKDPLDHIDDKLKAKLLVEFQSMDKQHTGYISEKQLEKLLMRRAFAARKAAWKETQRARDARRRESLKNLTSSPGSSMVPQQRRASSHFDYTSTHNRQDREVAMYNCRQAFTVLVHSTEGMDFDTFCRHHVSLSLGLTSYDHLRASMARSEAVNWMFGADTVEQPHAWSRFSRSADFSHSLSGDMYAFASSLGRTASTSYDGPTGPNLAGSSVPMRGASVDAPVSRWSSRWSSPVRGGASPMKGPSPTSGGGASPSRGLSPLRGPAAAMSSPAGGASPITSIVMKRMQSFIPRSSGTRSLQGSPLHGSPTPGPLAEPLAEPLARCESSGEVLVRVQSL
mmetsp:Transcript_7025/g.13551  ORF Transcript_7025/g.13551 Transcript_7025/m.13551 type:complete len:557 (-) Transcript_7025:51-1721(-)|eukprot:CAMPEP_0173417688 /NCGR_PEP_ID=MMETSP1356-20130122/86029_1 /TAXON_ID=77927 ORGANISM="Hemiselmis virescens, Strain PCC157" /NCGR_SAMPLE_ID=MMETSP1356 /ASSEMBLY_ACC=CAM_ASM_000847 /LENGTH=556 /DNA_ID=CAMNT_0014380027 /DNA_START=8 /DNA_END=1678 /DNA_ORIENTATION=+